MLCGFTAAWVPYWTGRAVHALELSRWADSRRMLLIMMAFTAVAGFGRYLMRNTLVGLSRTIELLQRNELYDFLLSRPFSFFERHSPGDLMSRMGEDIAAIKMATGPGLMSLLQTLCVMPVTVALMAKSSPMLTLWVLLPFLFLGFGFYLIGRGSHRNQAQLQLAASKLNTFSHETISGEKVVQAYCLENIRTQSFHDLSLEQARLNIRQAFLTGLYGPLTMLMGGLAVLVLVVLGTRMVLDKQLSMGDLTAFVGYLAALTWPVVSLGWSFNLFSCAKAGQQRIDQLLADPATTLPNLKITGESQARAVSITLEALSHRFENGRGLGPLDLHIPAGTSLAIVGAIGSGKTVLLQTLAGLRQSTAGRMLRDGVPFEPESLRAHWANLGWVGQEAFLFSCTLRENLALGKPDASEDEILEAARLVTLDGLLKEMPAGLDTVVGERGVILSGGERQRCALARALLRNPGMLLLDDSLSAVDADTESHILANLKNRTQGITNLFRMDTPGCTMVLATHRIFVAEQCDKVLVLEEGLPVEYGSPAQLAAQNGVFSRLKKIQSLEQDLRMGISL